MTRSVLRALALLPRSPPAVPGPRKRDTAPTTPSDTTAADDHGVRHERGDDKGGARAARHGADDRRAERRHPRRHREGRANAARHGADDPVGPDPRRRGSRRPARPGCRRPRRARPRRRPRGASCSQAAGPLGTAAARRSRFASWPGVELPRRSERHAYAATRRNHNRSPQFPRGPPPPPLPPPPQERVGERVEGARRGRGRRHSAEAYSAAMSTQPDRRRRSRSGQRSTRWSGARPWAPRPAPCSATRSTGSGPAPAP